MVCPVCLHGIDGRELPRTEDLHRFVVTVQCGSMTDAAYELGVSRNAVTDSVKRLERLCGAKLLTRSKGPGVPTRPTPRGQALVVVAGQILALAASQIV